MPHTAGAEAAATGGGGDVCGAGATTAATAAEQDALAKEYAAQATHAPDAPGPQLGDTLPVPTRRL